MTSSEEIRTSEEIHTSEEIRTSEDIREDVKNSQVKIRVLHPPRIKLHTNPYMWDGTYLGNFDYTVITNELVYSNLRYVQLTIWEFKTYAILVNSGNETNLRCIYDELKETFNLPKTGSHSIIIDSKYYVIYRASTSSGTILYDDELSEKIVKKYDYLNLRQRVAYFFTFRHLLGVSPNTVTNVKIRYSGSGFIYPVSFNDKFTVDVKNNIIKNSDRLITVRNFDKWFPKDATFSSMIKEMLHFNQYDSIPEAMSPIMNSVTNIIYRIDRDLLYIENIIRNTLIDYLED